MSEIAVRLGISKLGLPRLGVGVGLEGVTDRGLGLDVSAAVRDCLALYAAGEKPSRSDEKFVVKALLEILAHTVPGNSVEFRVPPYAAIQVVAGGRHRRGTPRAGIELDAQTFIKVATGNLAWQDAVENGSIQASGERSDLSGVMPLVVLPQGGLG